MKRVIKLIKKSNVTGVIFALSLVLLFYSINTRLTAVETGNVLGSSMGTAAGKAAGSFRGITEGRRKGLEDGKATGLSAWDTEAKVINSLQEIGKLQVLVADIKLKNKHEIGKDYKSLWLMRGEAVFTIDLSDARLVYEDGVPVIYLPKPEGYLDIDLEKMQRIAKSQTHAFKGSAKNGYLAFINSLKELSIEADNALKDNTEVQNAAKDSAVRQVKQLIEGDDEDIPDDIDDID